ncbi:MAG: GH92 family glycosyl hydrolase [Flavisolibacter sp.]
MNTNVFKLLCLFLIAGNCVSAQAGFTRFVNPFIGTDGTGHSFPGPCRPFGMVQPGPDNRDNGWDYTSGYQFKDSMIMGFSQTRANGTGINEFGDVLLQPLTSSNENYLQGYNKSSEKAYPGYYTVRLNNHVKVELACTERVAFHRYSYPSTDAFVLADFQHGLRFMTDSLVLESNIVIENSSTIYGYCHTSNWVNRKYFFVMQFDQEFVQQILLPKKPKDKAPRYLLKFHLPHRQLKTKISLSTVSVAGAKLNLKTELPGWNLEAVVQGTKDKWNRYLGRISIDASSREKVIFYTALYRLFIQPSNIADVNGQYRGPDDKIHQAINNEYYSTLSLWDTYRAAHPLYTIIAPEKVNGFIRSMISHSQQAGFLPIWTAWGQDNYCMIGNHSIPVIADAYRKGFKGFDPKAALQEMIKSTTMNHINSNWTLLNHYGYYPFDSLDNEAVSRTLEHGVDDYFVAQMANQMGQHEIYKQFTKRSKYYRNLYDSSTALFRGKDSRGEWRKRFDPLAATSPLNNPGDYTEANAWQYFWTPAQYDVDGIIALLGGKEKFTEKLDSFFSIKAVNPDKHLGQEAMIGQYAHGNEPSHHVAWLYAFSNKPSKGKELISIIFHHFYNDTPGGMIGNDDCGQMSAWYIFAALGLYPVNPASGDFVLSAPQYKKITVRLPHSKKLKITAHSSDKVHRASVTLNGNTVSKNRIGYSELMKGGMLTFNN